MIRRGGEQNGAAGDLTHVVQAGEEGIVFDAVITLDDAENADVVYMTNSFEAASVATGPLVPVLVDNVAPTDFSDVTLLPGRDLSAASEGDRMFAGGPFDIFDDLLARAFTCSSCLSHLPLLSGYDEPTTLSYQITLFGPISADVRQLCTLQDCGVRPVPFRRVVLSDSIQRFWVYE
jgi:hypothetical protein